MQFPTVLLIDPDRDSIVIYSLILRHHGFRVIHASDAESGLRMAAERKPDLVVSELFLPKLGGVSIVEVLRSGETTSSMPLIVLDSIPSFAAEYEPELRDTNRLTKPCEPSRLLKEVQRLLGTKLETMV